MTAIEKEGACRTMRWVQAALVASSGTFLPASVIAQGTQLTPTPDPVALERGMTGELLKNTNFTDWEVDRPLGWGWNSNQGCSAKPGPEGRDGLPTLEMVPNSEGYMDFGTVVDCTRAPLLCGDSLLLEVTLKVDEGVPMEIRVTLMDNSDASEKLIVPLPFQGDGNWNTLQLTIPELSKNVTNLKLDIRIRGTKKGTAYLSSVSLKVFPKIS